MRPTRSVCKRLAGSIVLGLGCGPLWQNAVAMESPATLIVRVTELGADSGVVIVTLYDSPERFLAQSARKVTVRPDGDGTIRAVFDGLEPGDYAVTVIHDRNENGKLDQGLLGIPKEQYGFSRGYRPKLRPPDFEDVRFEVAGPRTAIEVALP